MANTAKQLTLATEHLRAGNLTRARSLYRRIIDSDPKHAEAWYLMGLTAAEAGHNEPAALMIAKAIGLAGPLAHYCANLGRVLLRLDRAAEASACFRQALAGEPLNARIAIELACALLEAGDPNDAVLALEHAANLEPTSAAIAFHLGHQLRGIGRSDEAVDRYRTAAALAPDSMDAKLALAAALLETGQWREGFTLVRYADSCSSPIPIWDGSPLAGKRILLRSQSCPEDALQFVRYAPLVRAQGGTVVVECRPDLVTLLGDADGVDEVVESGDPVSADVQTSMAGLPGFFDGGPGDVTAGVPYLLAEQTLAEHWRAELNASVGVRRLRVGIAHGADLASEDHAYRTIPADQLAPLMSVAGVEWFNLQSNTAQNALSGARPLVEKCGDFAELAAAMVNLDLVIAADNPVAHLAGAMGRPVWTLLNRGAHWRWMNDSVTSTWYPAMRLFRHESTGGWQASIERAASELAALTSAR